MNSRMGFVNDEYELSKLSVILYLLHQQSFKNFKMESIRYNLHFERLGIIIGVPLNGDNLCRAISSSRKGLDHRIMLLEA